MHGAVLAAVAVAGFSVILRGGHAATTLVSADVASTYAAEHRASVSPTDAATLLRGSGGLARLAAPLGTVASTSPHGGSLAGRITDTLTPNAALAAGHAPAARETPAVAAASTGTPTPAALDLEPETGLRGAAAASRAEPQAPAEPTEIVRTHLVQPGDTLSTVAQRYGVSTATLKVANDVVTDPDFLKVGQQLWVPTKDGVLYFVRLGDTITDIAEEHSAKPDDIINFAPNKIPNADSIREGELLLIVGGHRPAPPPPPPPPPVVAQPAPAAPQPGSSAPRAAAPAPAPAPARPSGGGWQWPITGPLSSYFGPAHPLGIDVDLYGRAGAPVGAARAGVVSFAGGNPCCSYGYYVEVDHGDGFRTVYAHFQSPPVVRIGQRVAQGQVLGYAGTTGYSTGVHLHFEVRRAGVPVNPLAYLP